SAAVVLAVDAACKLDKVRIEAARALAGADLVLDAPEVAIDLFQFGDKRSQFGRERHLALPDCFKGCEFAHYIGPLRPLRPVGEGGGLQLKNADLVEQLTCRDRRQQGHSSCRIVTVKTQSRDRDAADPPPLQRPHPAGSDRCARNRNPALSSRSMPAQRARISPAGLAHRATPSARPPPQAN